MIVSLPLLKARLRLYEKYAIKYNVDSRKDKFILSSFYLFLEKRPSQITSLCWQKLLLIFHFPFYKPILIVIETISFIF